MFGSVGTLELIGLCFKTSCSKYHWRNKHREHTLPQNNVAKRAVFKI